MRLDWLLQSGGQQCFYILILLEPQEEPHPPLELACGVCHTLKLLVALQGRLPKEMHTPGATNKDRSHPPNVTECIMDKIDIKVTHMVKDQKQNHLV